MNSWLWAATVLLVALAPLGFVLLRAPLMDALVAVETVGAVGALVLLLLAQGFDRDVYFELAVVLAVILPVGGLIYVRLFERWL